MNGRNICALSLLDDPACQLLNQGAPQTRGVLHRLDKADTTDGLTSILPVVDLVVPFAMVSTSAFWADRSPTTATVFQNWLAM
jgi:hypothetical protein